MRVLIPVNDAAALEPRQTTTLLANTAAQRGHQVYVCGVAELSLDAQDRVTARARPVPHGGLDDFTKLPAALRQSSSEAFQVQPGDLVLLRTNPARDAPRAWAHHAALSLATLAQAQGARVVNDPGGLRRAANKLYLAHLPREFRPRTLVTHDTLALKEFVLRAPGPCVLKPLQGTHGQDVYFVQAGAKNLNQIVDALRRQGQVMAQDYIPEADRGDFRLIMLNGALLTVNGHPAAVNRVPGEGDFRSNVHAGGTATAAHLTDEMRRAARAIGPILLRDGIFIAGLDFIGGRVVEVNAFATGGLTDATDFAGGADFAGAVIEALEAPQ